MTTIFSSLKHMYVPWNKLCVSGFLQSLLVSPRSDKIKPLKLASLRLIDILHIPDLILKLYVCVFVYLFVHFCLFLFLFCYLSFSRLRPMSSVLNVAGCMRCPFLNFPSGVLLFKYELFPKRWVKWYPV